MALYRASATARSLTRRFATAPHTPVNKPSNVPLYLGGAGVVGLATYLYLNFGTQGKPKITQTKSPLDPENFLDFKLKKVEPYNHNTAKFTFELPNNEASLLPVASCVIVKSSDPDALKDAKGKPIIRAYTPISPSHAEGELTLLVKKYDSGNVSKHIHSLSPGDHLSIKGPIPKWPYKTNEFDQVALIGGGSGITPLYQILNHALPDKTNKTKFKLLFANVTEKDILIRKELDALKKQYPNNFDIVYVLSKPEKDWTGPQGYISADTIKEHVGPATLAGKVKIFVCGPPGQVAAIAGNKAGMKQGDVGGLLKELGYTEDQVYKF